MNAFQKTCRKVLSAVLAAALVIGTVPAGSAATSNTATCSCDDTCNEVIEATGHNRSGSVCVNCGSSNVPSGLEYTFYGNDVVITGYTGNATELVIPAVIEGKPVTTIGEYAFMDCSSLTGIDLPESVTTIEWYAFFCCSSLTNIDIPEGVTSIGGKAFAYCSSLSSIRFYGNAPTPSYTRPVFEGTTATAYYPAGNSTWTVYMRQQYGGNITWVPNGVTLPEEPVDIPEGLWYDFYEDHVEIVDYTGTATELVIPAKIAGLPVTHIGDGAFFECSGLTDIIISDGVTSIGDQAFWGCSNLTAIEIPDSVTSIGDEAFSHCSDLTAIEIPNGVTSIGYRTFSDCSSLTAIELPDSVVSIDDFAFFCCNSVTAIEIPDSVVSIGDYAFASCTGLTSIPEGVTSIGVWAFVSCTGLTSITIPEGVTSIGMGVFGYCTSLASITIPEGVTSIGYAAFAGCTGLTSIYFNGDAPAFGEDAFSDVTATAYYPAGNTTWTEDVMQDYCGNITWVAYHDEHDYKAVVTAPTCTEDGYTTYTCFCGDSYTADETAALGHNEVTLDAKPATCTEDGLTEGKKCVRCQEVLVAQTEIPAPGHNYENGTCTNCGDSLNPFTDVDEVNHKAFYDAILWAVKEGITTGATETTFDPNGTLLRAQFVTFLWRAAGEPEPTKNDNPFTDVKEGDYFYKAVLWAVEKEITNGISATEFGAYKNTNRAQAVTFLWRYLEKPAANGSNSFSDVVATEWYAAINWAVCAGVTNGMGDGTFGINTNCNRAQAVTFLYRAIVQ